MGYDEINVKADKTREIAGLIQTLHDELNYNKNKLYDYLCRNSGEAYNQLFTINGNTEICVNVTRQLFDCTARFFSNAADTFEEADYEIAREVSKNG